MRREWTLIEKQKGKRRQEKDREINKLCVRQRSLKEREEGSKQIEEDMQWKYPEQVKRWYFTSK